ncbi:hypothetical protein AU255_02215 [Methyloprofundus sedimenti]|uniref:AlpA family transcriptional regulator n=1 Tax=Methyloprofundus sedimenti TaxID=1420851 RepID=A0A1V8M5R4_9GAMM|nr:AlpA family phage regulatory protein [Methyloprofundus sedimenti]OQK16743.1 hypothetical protein AU255_02215 [Methyloprofundus sedimenti]
MPATKKLPETGLIRPATAAKCLGVSISTIWRWAKKPGFPDKIKLSDGITAFKAEEIHAWIESRRDGAV